MKAKVVYLGCTHGTSNEQPVHHRSLGFSPLGRHWHHSPEIIKENDAYKITSNNDIIGFIIISEQVKFTEILHCWITPSYIGQGLGSLLLAHVFELQKFKGKVFEVTADPNAVPFYQKIGSLEFDQQPSMPLGRSLPIMRMTNA